jgi:hypothetical protein
MRIDFMCNAYRRRRRFVLDLLCLLLLMAAGSTIPIPALAAQADVKSTLPASLTTQLSAAEIGKRALQASGAGSARGAWQLKGTANLHGAAETFEMVFDSRFRFFWKTVGDLAEMNLFDGSSCWTDGPSGVPHRLILHDRDTQRLFAWTLAGVWAERAAPLSLQPTGTTADELTILLKPGDGAVSATLLLDRRTSLPKSLSYWSDEGNEVWTFTEYRQFDKRTFPTHIAHTVGTQTDRIEITSAAPLPGAAPRFQITKHVADATEYDAAVSDKVEIKRVGGYLFVRPRVNGQELGWFFLDTGADVLCIDPSYAKQLNLAVIGGDAQAGAVGVTHTDICRADTFQLGPVTLKKPVLFEIDLTAISQAFKIPIAGICGYDFISRAVLDIDPQFNTMRVLPQGTANLAADLPTDVQWTRIGFNSNVPALECRFVGNHRGYFALDTGSGATVDFCAPAVEKFQLLANQESKKAITGGAGGTAESREGRVEWFELGGIRFKSLPAGFQLTKVGVFASPYLTGNIGMGLLGRFRLLIDYGNERIAFIPQSK